MSEHSCDVVVIGLGPGGEATATALAKEGLEVVAVESSLVGGECPYWGCIPSKMIIRAAGALAEARRVEVLAGGSSVTPDYSVVARRIREEATDDWDDTVAADRLTDAGATLVRGRGRLVGPRTVEVDGETYVARRGVVLNTGTEPSVPPVPGLADTPYWTNHGILEADELPASLTVIGGGAIGLELAQGFARFGCQVTVLEVGPRILAVEEPAASEVVQKALEADGVVVRDGVTIDRVDHDGTSFTVTCGDETITSERLLVAAGRRSRIHDLGLEDLGVDTSGRTLEVDDGLLVTDGLWAIGDIVGRGAFTHVSMYHSARVVDAILGREVGPYDTSLPRVTFTDPEVGAVGLTEKQAREKGLTVRVGSAPIPESSRGWIHKAGNDGLISVVVDADRGVVVGATSVGPTGGETMSALAVAVRAEVPVATLKNMIYAYPTFYRAIETALAEA